MNLSAHTFTVRTSRRHGAHGSSGYGVFPRPPLVHISEGADIEGIGWWQWPGGPQTNLVHRSGWARHRQDAEDIARQHRTGNSGQYCHCDKCKANNG